MESCENMKSIVTAEVHMGITKNKKGFLSRLWEQKILQLMVIPALLWMIVFNLIPSFGILIAFQDYMFKEGIFGSPWAANYGLQNFIDFFADPDIIEVIKNTFGISLLKVFVGFPIPIIFAILLNEVRIVKFKKFVQTVSYFPYFISWAILALMVTVWLSPSLGFFNTMLVKLHLLEDPEYLFLGDPAAFWWVAFVVEMWKTTGYAAIIYIASMAGIEQEMYEAADIDGAGRMDKILHITLPSLKGIILIMLILNAGSILNGGLNASNFQQCYLLQNSMNQPASEILDTYVLRLGIKLGRYSYATAVGLVTSVVSLIFLFTANKISAKLSDESLL